ncbi:MAG: efflux RND transporter permease subunit [SAR324 cluster bacterium]|nr:efflux RND transporter permease subunit [SAR324 cluster bacterium]
MVVRIIIWSIKNRFLVIIVSLLLTLWGIYSVLNTPVDALPDLSDVQVIIKTSYPGQAPQVVEDQVTYPITTTMLAVPRAVNVRGYSFFGDSYVYIIFEDGTDLYWARSRVLEYMNQVTSRLPPQARVSLGPDATGVGWIFQYALVDRTGKHDLSQLRSIQDWFLKFELQTVPGVSEVATIGGMVKQYQVVIDPNRLRAYSLTLDKIKKAIRRGNQEVGGSVVEMAEAEYMIRASGYIEGLDDLRQIPVGVTSTGTPILLDHVADIRIGPQMRRGIADLNGEGEVVGAVVIMRWGENALATIEAVKERLDQLRSSLPEGVEIVTTYDRSGLILRAIENLTSKLVLEFLVVTLVTGIFLFHVRSAFVAIFSLPVGILVAFIIMRMQGINANIMSLGGIAIAIGAMVDGAIVMVENVHKHAEKEPLTDRNRWSTIARATAEVGPSLFFALLIITVSFLPIFTLQAQEGRMFAPLAYTKTYAMAAAAFLSITLVPVLMGYFIRGKIIAERRNPINRFLMLVYKPIINTVLSAPKLIVLLALVFTASGIWPLMQIGSEFMPELDEGDLLYMPSTFPGISVGKARELLQQTDRLIKTVPEVKQVFGKIGRAESATDPAPLTMVETTIQLKPQDEWRPGMTTQKLIRELDSLVKFPGLTNAWVMPIKNRIDMLATGIKTPVGIKISGEDMSVIQEIGEQIERVLKDVPGTTSVFAERVAGGRFIDVDIDRVRAARHGLNISDVQEIVQMAIGGMNIAESVEGLERYPINIRYPQSVRDSVEKLRLIPIVTPAGAQIPLGQVATITINDGPAMIKSENSRPNGWVFIDIRDRDLGSYVADAQRVVAEEIQLPAGYAISWSGQYEYMQRAKERLQVVGPLTLLVIMFLLYVNFRRFAEVLIIMITLPLAAVGGLWLMYFLDYDFSVAVGVGFIALSGVAVEIGVIMLVYLNLAVSRRRQDLGDSKFTRADLRKAVIEGTLLRLRPIIMTVAAIIAGLLPIQLGGGTGSEVMRRIATPMVGGMASATVLTLLIIPAVFYLWWTWKLRGLNEGAISSGR